MTTLTHKQVAAEATITDAGEFEALASIFNTVDRVGDRVIPGAFRNTIAAWLGSGKMVPLHWSHSAAAEDIIGYVDPATMRETSEGLRVSRKVDLEGSAVGREAWRSVKANSIGLSFGYMVTKQRKRGKVNELLEIDLYEVSLTPSPAHPDARVLSAKSTDAGVDETTVDDDAERLRRIAAMSNAELLAEFDVKQRSRPPLQVKRYRV